MIAAGHVSAVSVGRARSTDAAPSPRLAAASPSLPPARRLPEQRDGGRLMVIAPGPAASGGGRIRATSLAALPGLLAPGDLLVVNDAATLPASLRGQGPAGQPLEARLIARRHAEDEQRSDNDDDQDDDIRFDAVLLGAGDWRTRTEDRPAPPRLAPGAIVRFAAAEAAATDALAATVIAVSPVSPRLVTLRFHEAGDAFWNALYRIGRPVQYAHLDEALPLWAVQNVYAERPWAFEMPSAGRPLTWRLLAELRARGVDLARLTHAAGLSATGDAALDARLPLPERFAIPADTVAAIAAARARGSRIIAVGTTVVRALEGAHARAGGLVPADASGITGVTDLRLSPTHRLQVVDGLLSGMHEAGESHFDLLGAFAAPALLLRANQFAAAHGFVGHELGDSTLILPRPRALSRP
jgi:S-adenosylmethionine:tRNA ribosyltransferase-isomerase